MTGRGRDIRSVADQVSLLAVVAFSLAVSLFFGSAILRHLPLHRVGAVTGAVTAKAADRPSAGRLLPVAAEASAPNVYSATTGTSVGDALAAIPARVYVPNSTSAAVDVIDPSTLKIVGHFAVGEIPYHITPSWDMRQLYVGNEGSSNLMVVDPRTGLGSGTIPVPHPYNLYFTPDGTTAIAVDERQRKLILMDRMTWAVLGSVDIPWAGVDHLDFSADGTYLLASTEFSGMVIKVDIASRQVAGMVAVGGQPIDVRLSPDGATFYVANQGRGGVSVVDPVAMREVGFIPTGKGAHGLQMSRDTSQLYVSNRQAGTISVIEFASRRVVGTWHTGGSPDMLQVSPDGRQVWASARFDRAVYVVDTASGGLISTIQVGSQPHGLSYFPNVGRFSLGHNGVYR